MSVSFYGAGEVVITCKTQDKIIDQIPVKVAAGSVVKLSANGTVTPCTSGEPFFGVAVSANKDGHAAVQIAGYVKVPYTGEGIAVGPVALAAASDTTVESAEAGSAARSAFVLDVDDVNSLAGLYL